MPRSKKIERFDMFDESPTTTEREPRPWRPDPEVIGSISEDDRNLLLARFFEHYYDAHASWAEQRVKETASSRDLEGLDVTIRELEKTDEERALIEFADALTNRPREQAGALGFLYPQTNIHFLSSATYRHGDFSHFGPGMHNPLRQEIYLDAERLRKDGFLPLLSTIVHELRHAKEFLAIKRGKTSRGYNLYRHGVSVYATEKREVKDFRYHEHFTGLREAIANEWDVRDQKAMLSHPLLQDEKEWLESDEAKRHIAKIAKKHRLREEEIYWVSRDGTRYIYHGYYEHNRVLRYVMGEILDDQSDQFSSINDVFDVFNKAQYGDESKFFLELARVVEKTFGKRSFRVLSAMGTKSREAISTLEVMRRFRADRRRRKK